MCLAKLSIDYDEGKQDTYRKITLEINEETFSFDTGDPIVDWWNYYTFIAEHAKEISIIISSSTVDHWYMDGNEYYEMFIDTETKQACDMLNVFQMSEEVTKKYLKFIAKKSMKTFDDLKQYIKKHKKETVVNE